MRKGKEVFTSKTGNGNSLEVQRHELGLIAQVRQPIMAKLVLAYGATPTVTVALQGLRLADETWETLVEATYTTGTPQYLKCDPRKGRHRRYRLNLSANTNVTVTTAHIGIGTVEN